MADFLQTELFGPLGITSSEAVPKFDSAGTFIASSFVYATARAFAKFGQLLLNNGIHEGQQILPSDWVQYVSALTGMDEDGSEYGRHFWKNCFAADDYSANGFDGQYIICIPSHDLCIVRFGISKAGFEKESLVERLKSLAVWAALAVENDQLPPPPHPIENLK
jgi:CubicO group peptidase (beta-lactamase class C family)